MKKNLSAILLSTALVISSAFTAFGAVEDTVFSDVTTVTWMEFNFVSTTV